MKLRFDGTLGLKGFETPHTFVIIFELHMALADRVVLVDLYAVDHFQVVLVLIFRSVRYLVLVNAARLLLPEVLEVELAAAASVVGVLTPLAVLVSDAL